MSTSRPRHGALAAFALAAALTLTACQSDDVPGASALGADGPSASASQDVPALRLVPSVKKDATNVPVDRELSVRATGGTIDTVQVTSPEGKIAGEVEADGSRWVASSRLEPGTAYTMTTVAKKTDGTQVRRTSRFTTRDLTLDEQTYPSVAPLADETVGVGMPVIVTFDLPVADKASFEKHMTVTSTPSQPGSWHWMSDTEAHWRPKAYWKAGTDVHVDVDVNSVAAGNGIYGQESRELDFHVGDAHIYRVNAQTHQMKVFSNGKLLRTLPITTGKPGFTTRSGVKVIIEKFDSKRMNSETVGIPAGSADAYDIDNVQWAMRVTYSGEFIHAAPWSVGSQGYANVSHGCTGLSTENAGWLYAMSRRGDVVEYTGTDRPMTLDNGYGDWNESFQQYRQGSALS
ncbi:Ig-like domain-containing protein [Nocardioides sp.]|uniref:L,D-transpeptidase n=1 Tax=Nocardioides sp. TaxID=35761 RepID=UPI0025CE5421|nr:Ig-like domain-containing protein [Nocardioides sp.]